MSAVSSFLSSISSGAPTTSAPGSNNLGFSTKSYTKPSTTEPYTLSWSNRAITTVRVRPEADGGGLLLQNGEWLAPNASPTTVDSVVISINPTPRHILYRAVELVAGGKSTATTRSGSSPTSTNATGGNVNSSSKKRKKKTKFGGGAIAGVVIGVIVTIAIVVTATWVILQRKKKAKEEIARAEEEKLPTQESERMLTHSDDTSNPTNAAYHDTPAYNDSQETGSATALPGKKEASETRA